MQWHGFEKNSSFGLAKPLSVLCSLFGGDISAGNMIDLIVENLDLRSFSNLWYWLVLAAVWSTTSYYPLGIPYEMVQKARFKGGAYEMHVRNLLSVQSFRAQMALDRNGPLLAGAVAFLLGVLIAAGFILGVEFAQAVALIAIPISLVMALRLRLAQAMAEQPQDFAEIYRRLSWHRRFVQLIGVVAIVTTSFWGTFVNFKLGTFGAF
jgi:hypothetical protein